MSNQEDPNHQLISAIKKVLSISEDVSALLGFDFRQFESDSTPVEIRRQLKQILTERKYISNEYAEILIARYWDRSAARLLAEQRGVSIDSVNRKASKAIEMLAAAVLRVEAKQIQAAKHKQLARLEDQNYETLFGVNDLISKTKSALLSPESPWIVALTGLGGAGKTSLADFISRELIENLAFEDVLWVRAAQQSMQFAHEQPALTAKALIQKMGRQLEGNPLVGPKVRQIKFVEYEALVRDTFSEKRVLLVLDNLETLRDVEAVIALLRDLVNPSKVLLTAREFPTKLGELGIRKFDVNELSVGDAAKVLLSHAKTIGGEDLAIRLQSHFEDIFDAVGGSPHTLKLVASLAVNLPMDVIIKDLSIAGLREIDRLYKYIYDTLWQALSEEAQDFLLTLTTTSDEGATLSYIQKLSGLGYQILPVVQELITMSLLEKRRSTQGEDRYGIHRLTKTYVSGDILG